MIKKIIITNFKGISALSIAPEHINVLCGPCGSGKSSALEAIRFALTGSGSASDISSGKQECSVEVVFSDGSTIERTRTRGGSTVRINGKKTSQLSASEYLEGMLGVTPKTLAAFCGADYIGSLSQKDITSLFLSVLPVQINFNKMIELVENMTARTLSA